MKTKINMVVATIIIRVAIVLTMLAIPTPTNWDNKELSYDVLGAQMSMTHYLMDLSARGGQKDEELVNKLQSNVDQACYTLIGRHSTRRCKIAVCYHVGISFDQCFD